MTRTADSWPLSIARGVGGGNFGRRLQSERHVRGQESGAGIALYKTILFFAVVIATTRAAEAGS